MRPISATAATLFVGGVFGTLAVLGSGCKNPSTETPAGPTTINTPTGGTNMASGIPATMPVSNTPQTMPATMPVPPVMTGTNSREPAATVTTKPATPPAPKVAMTHVLSMDEPYYKEHPTASAKPDGTLKAGSKVLLVVPGAKYSQVMTDDEMTVYTVTDGLDPIGK